MHKTLLLAWLVPLASIACRANLPPELDQARAADRAQPSIPAESPAPGVGESAPPFELPDLEDLLWNLSDLRGRTVVLLWFDSDCPFLVHAYERGGLGERAGQLATQGVVWLAIDSGKTGRTGGAGERNRAFAADHGVRHPILIDEDGAVGRAYGVKLAGEILVLAPDGTVYYRGALDNAPFGVPRRGSRIEPFVDLALEALSAGSEPRQRTTEPYGCRIRYAGP